jgi:3-carboxy-cis,cis-muconate cycloisomerase
MCTRLIESLATTEAMASVFCDGSVLQAMLDFESALARAGARAGVIPPGAAAAIAQAAQAEGFDAVDLARRSLRAGTPAIPLVLMLTARVRSTAPESAGFVHWGATSQDVTDTALVLLLRRCREMLAADHQRIDGQLNRLSGEHAASVMLGRTLMQPAPTVTFGLKAAGWLAALRRGWTNVARAFDEALILQFGGASGTLAALGECGLAVSQALAEELALPCPAAPWHSHRDRMASLMTSLGIYTASLGKMALDLSLLMQYEVGEAAEPASDGRGGSSTMPNKRNPTACMLTLAAAHRVPGLVANFLSGMLQEHERAVGGSQAEWSTVAGIVQSAGVAVSSMAEAVAGLAVFPDRMRANIEATRGAVFAERATVLLGEALGRDRAHLLVGEAARQSAATGRALSEVLAGIAEVTRLLTPDRLAGLQSPEDYLGSAEAFRVRLLAGTE